MSRVGNDIRELMNFLSKRLDENDLEDVWDMLESIEILSEACIKSKCIDEVLNEKKYYFITYQGSNNGDIHIWNDVIDQSPISFIKFMNSDDGLKYNNFILLNSLEISVEDFNEYKLK